MIEYFKLDTKCIANKEVDINAVTLNAPANRVEDGIFKDIKRIIWLASLRPEETGLLPYCDEKKKYEEIQILQISLKQIENMYIVANTLMKTVKYPTILVVEHHGKYMVCMAKAYINQKDKYSNVIRGFIHTSWLYVSEPSLYTQKVLSTLDIRQYTGTTLCDIYGHLFDEMVSVQGLNLSKSHVWELLAFYVGSGDAVKNEVIKGCDVYKYYRVNPSKQFQKRNTKSSAYIWEYDYEDLWHCFMKKIPDVMKAKGIRTMGQAIKYMCDCKPYTNHKFIYEESSTY